MKLFVLDNCQYPEDRDRLMTALSQLWESLRRNAPRAATLIQEIAVDQWSNFTALRGFLNHSGDYGLCVIGPQHRLTANHQFACLRGQQIAELLAAGMIPTVLLHDGNLTLENTHRAISILGQATRMFCSVDELNAYNRVNSVADMIIANHRRRSIRQAPVAVDAAADTAEIVGHNAPIYPVAWRRSIAGLENS